MKFIGFLLNFLKRTYMKYRIHSFKHLGNVCFCFLLKSTDTFKLHGQMKSISWSLTKTLCQLRTKIRSEPLEMKAHLLWAKVWLMSFVLVMGVARQNLGLDRVGFGFWYSVWFFNKLQKLSKMVSILGGKWRKSCMIQINIMYLLGCSVLVFADLHLLTHPKTWKGIARPITCIKVTNSPPFLFILNAFQTSMNFIIL